MDGKAGATGVAPTVTLREFVEKYVDERQKYIDARILAVESAMKEAFIASEKAVAAAFAASEKATQAALAAAEKAVSAAFAASEKAVLKAEDAQKDYNNRSNEFRGQLDDQAKMLMPRTETMALFKNSDAVIAAIRNEYDVRLEAMKQEFSQQHTTALKDLQGLRESRSEHEGKGAGSEAMRAMIIAGIGVMATILSIIALAAAFFKR